MSSEAFVVNAVKASEQVSALVSDLLGPWVGLGRDEVLYRLPHEESAVRLAEQLQCQKDQVFDELATRVVQSLIEGRRPPAFAIRHLHLLMREESRRRLARALMCDLSQTLNELFDVNALMRILFEVEPSEAVALLHSMIQRSAPLPSAESALISLLKLKSPVEMHYQMNEYQWGLFLEERGLLRDSALSRLRSYALEHNFADDLGANLLAATLETRASTKPDDERHLDALAILHIRQRIDWIVRQMRDQTEELALTVGEAVPGHSPLVRLRPHIEFYELKAPARAWHTILDLKDAKRLENEPTLREKLAMAGVRSTGAGGNPKKQSFLRVRAEEVRSQPPKWQFWKKPQVLELSLIVSCEVDELDAPVDILVCPKVSLAQVAALTKLFTVLPGYVIAPHQVSDIGEQLLKSRYMSIDTFRRALVNACAELLPQLIQSLILAGVDLPGGMESPWDEDLSYQLPLEPVDRERDTVFPLSRAEILSYIRQVYANHGNLMIVE
jgi:hypothetical protein